MKIGFSFSPGGLLFPYHVGVLASLSHHGYISESTPLAGSSAGAIAVAAHACRVDAETALSASIRISKQCNPFFLAAGQLMPSLQKELDNILDVNAHEIVNERQGMVGLAHYEIFPANKPRLQTKFESRESLIDAICDSSMFPYFTSNRPWRVVKRKNKMLPRVVVDGIFTEPIWRMGCPSFHQSLVDRTICISVAPIAVKQPTDLIHNTDANNIICPKLQITNAIGQLTQLGLMATTSSTAKSLKDLYDSGWADAERWIEKEENIIR